MRTHLRGLFAGITFGAVALVFAYAVPAAVRSAQPSTDPAVSVRPAVRSTPKHTSTATVPDDGDDQRGDSEDKPADNHGGVVSAAAHCPLKGAAHGALVRSIAKDKQATVADAEAACKEALASVDATAGGKSAHRPLKPEKPARPAKAPKEAPPGQAKSSQHSGRTPDPGEAPSDEESESGGGPPAHSNGKGNGKKP